MSTSKSSPACSTALTTCYYPITSVSKGAATFFKTGPAAASNKGPANGKTTFLSFT